ncbi:alpha,alpha-trehalose-phosphate synthase (UDP-forming) [Vulcanococcus sp.]|uniref:alpha,alpha-trehalose-phosphate synthase (UDP-forming) n=1 Tax=Vulcanococcus sp. TaxID=2856995 RepID=UPI003F69FDB9
MAPFWSRERLQALIQQGLGDLPLLVVSNREPWIHRHSNGGISAERPASGLVSALEPFAEASGGTWIAHGSGDADRCSVDACDGVAVPPGQPRYRLRRVWLSEAEQEGYYTHLANRALWPLCHVAFVPPHFEEAHWRMYRQVNARFADAVLQEAAGEAALVFLQDYHLALVPRLLRQANPKLLLVQFWHVPWPNRELLRTFPQADALIHGLLGNDLIGFQIPAHARNFLDAADRLVEARVDPDDDQVHQNGHRTHVGAYPISIDFQQWSTVAASDAVTAAMQSWQEQIGVHDPALLGVGMERLDYTKGLTQRLLAVERLLERHPEWHGRFCFVQLLATSRTEIAEYRQLRQELEQITARVNDRWADGGWCPLQLRVEQRELEERLALQRLGRFCVVSSLHDGMNLVAKEFVAARCDGDGVLILSRFAGCALELGGALQVHPYCVEQIAEAMARALSLDPADRRLRMAQMRRQVADHNVFRWGASILADSLRLRDQMQLHPASLQG